MAINLPDGSTVTAANAAPARLTGAAHDRTVEVSAAARRPDESGITAEEFQARRDQRVAAEAEEDLDSFDPSSLRSDR